MPGDLPAGLRQLASTDALAFVRRLQATRALREETGLFFAEGVRNFIHALEHGWAVEAILYSDRLLIAGIARSRVRDLARRGVPTWRLSPEEFRSISTTPRASGISILLRQRLASLHRTRPGSGRCWLVLDTIHAPGNLGTLLRTSTAVAGAGLILVGPAIDPFCPATVRASMGSLFRRQIVRTSVGGLASWARRHRLQVVGATPEATHTHFQFRFRTPSLLVLGNERSGIAPALREICTGLVRIPMDDGLDSLNVSVAGSLLMYEVLRCSPPGARPGGSRTARISRSEAGSAAPCPSASSAVRR